MAKWYLEIKVKTIGVGNVGKNGETFVHNILLVDNLSYNLLSISQSCDRNLFILFKKHECLILDSNFNINFKGKIFNDIFVVILKNINSSNFQCLKVSNENSWLWHRKFCHFNMNLLKEIFKKDSVRDLQKN